MDRYEALRLIALRGAYRPDTEASVRYVMRWYSKTFHTPLHEVYELPLDDIWLAFYEERYQSMDPNELESEVAEALESPEARNEREMSEEVEKASVMEFAKMSESMSKTQPINKEVLGPPKVPETVLPVATPVIEEGIEMEFVDPEEMERLLSGGTATETKVNPMSFK